jgi:DNA-directed RNA polymerase specialized sigma24 family protein
MRSEGVAGPNVMEGSVTLLIRSLKAGDERAASSLWSRCFGGLVRLARGRLRGAPRTVSDEEDIALSAFHCLWQGVTADRFPRLFNRGHLWRLLASIAAKKAADQRRHDRRKKRGGGRTICAVDLGRDDSGSDVLAWVAPSEPSSDAAAVLDEDCRRLLERLGDGELRQIAVWKLEGYDNDEIAQRLGCSPRSLSRRLGAIREAWLRGGRA